MAIATNSSYNSQINYTYPGTTCTYGSSWKDKSFFSFTEDTVIGFTLKSGEIETLTLKDYIIFILINNASPSEFTKEQYKEKSFWIRL